MSTFRKAESKVEIIEDVINFISNWLSVDDPTAPATNFLPVDSIHVTLASQDQLTASTLNPLASCHVQDAEPNSLSDQYEMNIPSELISHCLATLLMIQVNHIATEFDVLLQGFSLLISPYCYLLLICMYNV